MSNYPIRKYLQYEAKLIAVILGDIGLFDLDTGRFDPTLVTDRVIAWGINYIV